MRVETVPVKEDFEPILGPAGSDRVDDAPPGLVPALVHQCQVISAPCNAARPATKLAPYEMNLAPQAQARIARAKTAKPGVVEDDIGSCDQAAHVLFVTKLMDIWLYQA